MDTQTLYIMQGPPGSGKSELAERLFESKYVVQNRRNWVICSTDDYFTVNGEYKFDSSKLEEYHARNLKKATDCMKDGYNVIVDNTNIKCWQCKPYVQFAVENGINVVFIRVTGSFANKHGVPDDVVERMRNSMEDLTVESVLASMKPFTFEKVLLDAFAEKCVITYRLLDSGITPTAVADLLNVDVDTVYQYSDVGNWHHDIKSMVLNSPDLLQRVQKYSAEKYGADDYPDGPPVGGAYILLDEFINRNWGELVSLLKQQSKDRCPHADHDS